jgi:uncharacterized protein YwgA
MSDTASYISHIISLNGGTIVGKTRLQKTAYFLEEYGVGCGFDFEYYYYGPYSEDISIAIGDAKALSYIDSEWKVTKAGAEYAIFRSINCTSNEDVDVERKRILRLLSEYDTISIELAATADFLGKNGFSSDPWAETIRRKEKKATDERVHKAKTILSALGTFGNER